MGRRRRKRRLRFNLKKDSALSISAVFLLLISVLTLISFFIQAAYINSAIQDTLNSVFGWTSIAVPFILGLAGLIMLRTVYWPFVNLRVLVGLIFATVCLSGFFHFFVEAESAREQALLGQGGGLLGFFIAKTLRETVSGVGAFFVLIVGVVIGVLVTINTSLSTVFDKFGVVFSFVKNCISQIRANGADRSEIADTDGKEEEAVSETEEKLPQPEVTISSVEVIASLAEPTTGLTEDTAPSNRRRYASDSSGGLRHETVVNKKTSDKVWEYPPLSLLSETQDKEADRGDVSKNARIIEDTLDSFGIKAKVAEINLGPSVTQYALSYTQGTKISKVKNLQNDLAMALASTTGSVRIEAPIPGKSLVGVEVPNQKSSLVGLRSILTTKVMKKSPSKLTVCLGTSISGEPLVADLARMPHVLLAGATGSGKSTLIHVFLTSLLFRCSPSELKLIMVDTKRVELTEYNDIPHLLTPVVVEPEKVVSAFKWAISEMERRYKLFQSAKVRNITGYNKLSGFQALPFIVILVDELADMMMLAPMDTEKAICRLAQLARATGIHLVLSTQRPSVNILTGLIKANIPCRIAFNVTSQIDSRVIIDQAGAEKLLGSGDMLYVPPNASKPRRVQGAFVSSDEIRKLTEFLKNSQIEPDYKEEVLQFVSEKINGKSRRTSGFSEDVLYQDAVDVVVSAGKGSASLLQRKLRIGYARAARLLDDLEQQRIVGPAQGSKQREVLVGAVVSKEEDYYYENSSVDS